MPNKDLTGERFGMLTVESEANPVPRKDGRFYRNWNCKCDCGNTLTQTTNALKRKVKGIKNCGCTVTKRRTYDIDSPEYSAWLEIKRRCYNKNSKSYKNYGAKGIVMCDEWLKDAQAFIDHIGPRPSSNHSVDRYPLRDGNYEPGNVRWATVTQQNFNKEPSSNNSSGIRGVHFDKHHKVWKAQISRDKQKLNLGSFKTKEEAIAARKAAEIALYPNTIL